MEEFVMAWFVLVLSGMLEAVWATALDASDGLRRRGPVIVFLVAVTLSMAGLAWAMTSLPTGTAYAVWVGIGATLTVLWGFITGQEAATWLRVLLLVVLIGSVVGLKAVS
ncbi:DMT family transporter [Propionibacteriaceae bacterium Y1923]|uniref:DMT family transporter n=1 Tax=Aestuariimicrobium sp. Y1814 TaxID=3418742 RepID=UPI003C231EB4